jgi:hypothetical protein
MKKFVAIAAAASLFALGACGKTAETPAENAALENSESLENLSDALDNVSETTDNAAVADAADNAGDAAEAAADNAEEAVDNGSLAH